jgi:RNA polymerase sigma-70 factor (ECF subfamily)
MQGQAPTDSELWKLVQDDKPEAYGLLYRRYMELIFVEIHKRVESRADAEDLTQDLFQSIWEKRHSIQIEGRFFSYLWRSAQNRTLNYFRDRKIPASLLATWAGLEAAAESLSEEPQYFESDPQKGMQALIEKERSLLPLRMRQVYELRYEKELPVDEIASRLLISSNTVHNHLKALRRRFADALKKASFLFSIFH